MRKVRIGMIVAMPKKWKVDENWSVIESLVRRHAEDGVDIFITPECFLDGYAVTEDDWTVERFTQVAQVIDDSPYVDALKKLAVQTDAHIVFGLTERQSTDFYNCALLIGRDGEVAGKYYKTHLQSHDLRFTPGWDLPVFELNCGKDQAATSAVAGMVICADRRWPETIRTLRVKGAEILLMPTYGMWHLDNEWWMRTRAYENEMFVCFTHPNVALITNPKGQVEAKLQSNIPSVLIHDLDLDELTTNMLKDRRPELYRALGDTTIRFE
ncbi:MAG: carbon-nitrogen hydrolase family protein [Candidatus Poribacteria bacterium]|nr:carbon-nitrogen hydrolase family protein [Candidatus Poribacteria bacterium]